MLNCTRCGHSSQGDHTWHNANAQADARLKLRSKETAWHTLYSAVRRIGTSGNLLALQVGRYVTSASTLNAKTGGSRRSSSQREDENQNDWRGRQAHNWACGPELPQALGVSEARRHVTYDHQHARAWSGGQAYDLDAGLDFVQRNGHRYADLLSVSVVRFGEVETIQQVKVEMLATQSYQTALQTASQTVGKSVEVCLCR